MAQEFVGVCHRDLNRVRELVEAHPALANAAVDWGFGDWETALGAASHTGRREIAELLLSKGAHITIYAAAMLGQLDLVKAIVAARPGIQSTYGPHGITLLAHAKAGGPPAEPVMQYLQALGGADPALIGKPLTPAQSEFVSGQYVFGPGPQDSFEVDIRNDLPGITRAGGSRVRMTHAGDLVFFPNGARSVKIAFAPGGKQSAQFTIADPAVFLTAKRR